MNFRKIVLFNLILFSTNFISCAEQELDAQLKRLKTVYDSLSASNKEKLKNSFGKIINLFIEEKKLTALEEQRNGAINDCKNQEMKKFDSLSPQKQNEVFERLKQNLQTGSLGAVKEKEIGALKLDAKKLYENSVDEHCYNLVSRNPRYVSLRNIPGMAMQQSQFLKTLPRGATVLAILRKMVAINDEKEVLQALIETSL